MVERLLAFPKVRALIFDLDGTLIDSKLDLALAVNAVLAEMGRGPLPHEQIFGYIGQGAPSLIARALGDGATEEGMPPGSRIFLSSIIPSTSSTIPRCIPASAKPWTLLPECPWRVLTNKPVGASRGILQGLGLADTFRSSTAATV